MVPKPPGTRARMLRAILFDFNGVIADDETPHFVCFQQALQESGLALTNDEYYGTYLGMDERTCAEALLVRRDGFVDRALHARITARKADLFRDYTAAHPPPLFPGIERFVQDARRRFRLAVASGGRREQILAALRGTSIERAFDVIVSAEDVAVGKPDPFIYLHTLKLLNGAYPHPPLLGAAECLVIEDSRAGILAAKAAGMRVVAVATTYPAEQLADALGVVQGLEGRRAADLERLLEGSGPEMATGEAGKDGSRPDGNGPCTKRTGDPIDT